MKPDLKTKSARILLPAAFWLAIWCLAAACVDQPLLVPSPIAVLRRLGELAAAPLFWRSTLVSLLRIFCGALAGTILGTLCAVLVRATPVASFIILVLLWVSTGKVPGVISALMVLPVVWESVSAGIRSADPQLLELARSYQFSRRKQMRYVYLPAVRPHFAAGVCTAIGLAWKSGVAAEVLCLPKAAIGTQVYYSKIYLETPSLFAWTAVVIVLSMLLERIVHRLLGVKGGRKA